MRRPAPVARDEPRAEDLLAAGGPVPELRPGHDDFVLRQAGELNRPVPLGSI